MQHQSFSVLLKTEFVMDFPVTIYTTTCIQMCQVMNCADDLNTNMSNFEKGIVQWLSHYFSSMETSFIMTEERQIWFKRHLVLHHLSHCFRTDIQHISKHEKYHQHNIKNETCMQLLYIWYVLHKYRNWYFC